jgi:hypothetical protein
MKKLYLAVATAFNAETNTNYLAPCMYIDTCPESVKVKALAGMQEKNPGCFYRVGEPIEVPQHIIDEIKDTL